MFHALPPDVTIIGECHVGVDDVFIQTAHAVGVGQHVGARRHAKVAGFRVNGVQLAIGTGLDPGNVVTHSGDRPAVKAGRWHQHGKVGLAAGAREGRCHVMFLALRVGGTQNHHVFSQPALVTRHVGGNAQRKTLLAQQGVATITRAKTPDFAGFRVVHDVLVGVAGPGYILLADFQWSAHGVHTRHKFAVGAEYVIHGLAHARHDLHVDRHVSTV